MSRSKDFVVLLFSDPDLQSENQGKLIRSGCWQYQSHLARALPVRIML